MNRLFREYWEFTVKQPPDELASRLRASVQREWLMQKPVAPFVGEVEGLHFGLLVQSRRRPRVGVLGEFAADAAGTRVRLRVEEPSSDILLGMGCVFVAGSVLYTLPIWGTDRPWGWWLPAMAVAWLILATCCFLWDFYDKVAHAKELFLYVLRLPPDAIDPPL